MKRSWIRSAFVCFSITLLSAVQFSRAETRPALVPLFSEIPSRPASLPTNGAPDYLQGYLEAVSGDYQMTGRFHTGRACESQIDAYGMAGNGPRMSTDFLYLQCRAGYKAGREALEAVLKSDPPPQCNSDLSQKLQIETDPAKRKGLQRDLLRCACLTDRRNGENFAKVTCSDRKDRVNDHDSFLSPLFVGGRVTLGPFVDGMNADLECAEKGICDMMCKVHRERPPRKVEATFMACWGMGYESIYKDCNWGFAIPPQIQCVESERSIFSIFPPDQSGSQKGSGLAK